MSTSSSWHYDRQRLAEALSTWMASGPDEVIRAELNEALMDLIRDPLGWGAEHPNVPGVFHRSVRTATGVTIGILYAIPDLDARAVAVADIRTGR